jgi:hypothetical protein
MSSAYLQNLASCHRAGAGGPIKKATKQTEAARDLVPGYRILYHRSITREK